MLSGIKTIWKVGMGVGAAVLAGSIGGACYDAHQAKKSVSLLDDEDDFDDIEDDVVDTAAEG